MGPRQYKILFALTAMSALCADENPSKDLYLVPLQQEHTLLLDTHEQDPFEIVSLDDKTSTPPISENAKAVSKAQSSSPHHIDIGGNYSYAWVTPDGNPTTKGSLGGTRFLYEYCPMNCVYTGAAFNWREGKTVNGSSSSRSLQEFDVQSRIGYTFYSSSYKFMATLFTGLGWHYMPETVKLGSASVDFRYTEFYVPVGLLLEEQFTDLFSFGVRFQWMPQIFPVVRIVPLSGSEWSLENHLNNFFVDFPLKIATSSSGFFSVIISPFFEIWHDGKSTAQATAGFEGPAAMALGLPGNRYVYTGVNVDLRFAF